MYAEYAGGCLAQCRYATTLRAYVPCVHVQHSGMHIPRDTLHWCGFVLRRMNTHIAHGSEILPGAPWDPKRDGYIYIYIY